MLSAVQYPKEHCVAGATPRAGLTRDAAIAAARWQYQALVAQALILAPESESYIKSLAHVWDERLNRIRLPTRLDTSLPDHVRRRFEFLAAAIGAVADPEMAIAWVDAYPLAITELLPPSQSTFRVEDGASGAAPSRDLMTTLAA